MHPEFPEIVEMLSENALGFTMVTNGWDFVDWYQSVKRHLDTIRRVVFSLDGATEAIHDSNRAEGSYRRVLQAVSICRHKEIPFGIRTTVTKKNIDQLEEIALLAAKIGAEELVLIPLLPTPRMAALKLIPTPEDLEEVVERAARLRKIFRMKITLAAGYFDPDPLALCPPMTMKQLFVTSKGEVGFCCHLNNYDGGAKDTDIIGNLDEMSLHEAHEAMIDAVAAYRKEKIQHFEKQASGTLDHFPCWYCLKYFEKVDWLAEFPGNPWADELPGATSRKPMETNAEIRGR